MKKRLIKILLLLLTFITGAQLHAAPLQGQAKIDSLLKELPKAKEDTNKVKMLVDISNKYININPDEGLKYGQQGLGLAESLLWKTGIAMAESVLGANYSRKSDYPHSLECYNKTLSIAKETNNKDFESRCLVNIGIIRYEQSDYTTALEYYFKALDLYEKTGNKNAEEIVLGNIGTIYMDEKNYPKALDYSTKALKISEELHNKALMGTHLLNIGNIYLRMNDNPKASEYCNKSLIIAEEKGDKRDIISNLSVIGIVYGREHDYSKALEYLQRSMTISEELGSKLYIADNLGNIGDLYLNMALNYKPSATVDNVTVQSVKEILFKAKKFTDSALVMFIEIGFSGGIIDLYKNLSSIDSALGDYAGALAAYKQYALYNDSVFSGENKKKIFNLETKRQLDLKDKQIEIDRLAIAKKKNERVFFGVGIAGLLLVIVFIARERKRSDTLLLNILPAKIAQRLKQKEHPIADHFSEASILFIDMSGFTKFTEGRDPKETVSELNKVFTKFDALAEKHGLEKIKTIGDCYMAVAGLPEPQADHAARAAAMALDIKESLKDYTASDGTPMQFRMGLDSGPVVAGVIGKKKFIYDLWGDAVNTASRMETTGVVGEVHCTDNFKKTLGTASYSFSSRGVVDIKGKGQMETWLIS